MTERPNAWILYVDDDEIDHLLFKKAVEKYHPAYIVKTCLNGEEGLNFLKANLNNLPDIIFSDVNMSKVNGFELLKKINEESVFERLSIPFIFLSTSIVPKEVETAYALKAKGFFTKNTSPSQFAKDLDCIITYWEKSHTPK
jgi:CheY-like chemotaxis protein